jgi:Transposase
MPTSAGTVTKGRAEVSKIDALGRRYLSLEQKQKIVAEALAPNVSVAEVARRHESLILFSIGSGRRALVGPIGAGQRLISAVCKDAARQ